jgi:hypothetical protein
VVGTLRIAHPLTLSGATSPAVPKMYKIGTTKAGVEGGQRPLIQT